MAVSKRLRFEILRRDDHACRYCGDRAPDVKLTVDHVIPVALGGTDSPENLVAACAPCNSGKSSASPDATIVANVADDALRWAAAMRTAAGNAAEDRAEQMRVTSRLDYVWKGMLGEWAASAAYYRPRDWEHSIYRFLDLGLTYEDLALPIHRTMTNSALYDDARWKYFCGICWRVLKQRQETARELIAAGL